MTSDFERIKNDLNLLDVITRKTGLTMKGKHLSECPFCHGHACLSIFNNGQSYKCHQCPAAGDVFTFIEQFDKVDAAEALKEAAKIANITLQTTESKGHRRISPEIALTIKESIYIEAAAYYHTHMLDNGGKEYLVAKRGHKEDVLKELQVGWTDGGLVEHLRSKGFSDAEIKASWLGKELTKDKQPFLVDRYQKGWAIFPHFLKKKVIHFTHKDPEKKPGSAFQLPNEFRDQDWRFYNQDALTKFHEIIVVEGENDLASVKDADVPHVIGMIGSPAEYQIKALQDFCRQKHLYLWLDNDEDKEKPYAKGKGYIRTICQKLGRHQNIRVIIYPEEFKDPDEYLKSLQADKPASSQAEKPASWQAGKLEIKRLQDEALDYISWEIREIGYLKTKEDRLKALKDRKVFAAVADMVEVEKLVYIEKLVGLGFTESSIEEQLEVNHDLRNALAIYFEKVQKKDADPNYIASLIFKNLSEQGRGYRDRMGDCYLLYHHCTYTVGNNRPFNALMKKLTSLLPTKEPGRSTWESLASEIYTSGVQIDLASWIHTDRATDTIYINLNSPNNAILKVSKDGVEEVENGMNKEGVLLKSSLKILPMNFHPDAEIREGMTAIKELIFDNLTCEKEQRYLVLCWFISAFLLDFCPYQALMAFRGASAAGKTTAARLLSLLIYGNEHLGDPTAASAYAIASQNPLLIIDNLESDDISKSMSKFLLLSATKGAKEKRTQGTNTDTIQEQPKSLILITAIEPFLKAEHINRTYDIDFISKFKNDAFVEDEVIRSIVKKRDLILSSILKFITREILPNLEARKDYITILKKEHKNHAKNRTDEYLALLMLMLEKMLRYIPYYDKDDFLYGTPEEISEATKEIRHEWISYQNAKAKDNETSSNSIIKLLDGLVREYIARMKDLAAESYKDYPDEDVFRFTHPDYHIEVVKTKAKMYCAQCHRLRDTMAEGEHCECEGEQAPEIYSRAIFEFTANSGEIVGALDRYCRNNGIKNPYESPAVFTKRLSNDEKTLKSAGWELVTREGLEPYFKIIRGERFLKFKKVIIR